MGATSHHLYIYTINKPLVTSYYLLDTVLYSSFNCYISPSTLAVCMAGRGIYIQAHLNRAVIAYVYIHLTCDSVSSTCISLSTLKTIKTIYM